MIDEAFDSAGAFGLNYPEFPDSCAGIKLALVVNIDQMLIRRLYRYLIKLGDTPLWEPNGFFLEVDLDFWPAVIALKEKDLATGQGFAHLEAQPFNFALDSRISGIASPHNASSSARLNPFH
jgi:hypothetical protein